MSTESDKIVTPAAKPQSTGLKKVQTVLGIASAVTFATSFIPGINDIGAVIQGGITLAQTAIDFKQSGFKKAALTFATGSILTGMMLVPSLGAAGKLAVIGKDAMLAETATKTAKVVEDGSNLGQAAPRTNLLQKAAGFVEDVVKGAKEQTGRLLRAVNGIPPIGFITKHINNLVIEPVKNAAAPVFAKSRDLQIDRMARLNGNARFAKVARTIHTNKNLSRGLNAGLFAGGFAPALIPGGDAPKASPDLNPDATSGHLAALQEREKQARELQLAAATR